MIELNCWDLCVPGTWLGKLKGLFSVIFINVSQKKIKVMAWLINFIELFLAHVFVRRNFYSYTSFRLSHALPTKVNDQRRVHKELSSLI